MGRTPEIPTRDAGERRFAGPGHGYPPRDPRNILPPTYSWLTVLSVIGMTDSMFPPHTPETHQERASLAPETNTAFREFSEEVFAEGALSEKTKQLMAVAAGHVTQCPYCIRGHAKGAQKSGATREEVMETIWVAARLRADSVHTLAEQNLGSLSETDPVERAPDTSDAFRTFGDKVFEDGALSERTKRLLGVTVAHATRSELCISGQIELAREAGATDDELVEAIWVAVEMQTGAGAAHATIALDEMSDAET